jgi:hypothetical protein
MGFGGPKGNVEGSESVIVLGMILGNLISNKHKHQKDKSTKKKKKIKKIKSTYILSHGIIPTHHRVGSPCCCVSHDGPNRCLNITV